jgi:hypothetical protein
VGFLLIGYVALTAYMVNPDGPWDDQAVTNAKVAAGTALVLSAFLALITYAFVRTGRLRRWWYVLPALVVLTALARLTLAAPEL